MMHESAMNFLKRVRNQFNFESPVLEIGSININGSARDVFGDLTPYVGVDIVDGPNVDVVADIRDSAIHTNIGTHKYQTIILTEVLEHVDPESIISAIPKYIEHADPVYIVITCAGPNRRPHSADGAPTVKPDEYYKNVDPVELNRILRNQNVYCELCIVELSPDGTDVYAIAQWIK